MKCATCEKPASYSTMIQVTDGVVTEWCYLCSDCYNKYDKHMKKIKEKDDFKLVKLEEEKTFFQKLFTNFNSKRKYKKE